MLSGNPKQLQPRARGQLFLWVGGIISSRNFAASWLKGHLSLGQEKRLTPIPPLLWGPHSKGLVSWCGYRGGGMDTSARLIPSSKHYQERPDKSLLRRFLLKRWYLISPHQIPHGVVIGINLALVVHAALARTPPATSCVWVSPAAGPEGADGNRNGLCSRIASSPRALTRSGALPRSAMPRLPTCCTLTPQQPRPFQPPLLSAGSQLRGLRLGNGGLTSSTGICRLILQGLGNTHKISAH